MSKGRWFICSVCRGAAFKNRNTVHRCCGKKMGVGIKMLNRAKITKEVRRDESSTKKKTTKEAK